MNKPLINILIRTNNRPNYFKGLTDSLLSQTYKNTRLLIGYDNPANKKYINVEESFPMKRTSAGTFPYNLYENQLMKHVRDGWIMFLDDDDQFTNTTSLKTIVDHITSEDHLLLWRVQIHNRVVPEDCNWEKLPIRRSHISGIGFMFHKKYEAFAQWDANKASDHRVIHRLTQAIPSIIWINKVLTELQQRKDGKRLQGFGNQRDK